jgi:hypothetical protein
LKASAANSFATALSLTASPSIRFTTEVNQKVINDVLLTNLASATGNVAPLADYTKDFGISINTVNPNIKFTITIPRPIDNDPSAGNNFALVMLLGLRID